MINLSKIKSSPYGDLKKVDIDIELKLNIELTSFKSEKKPYKLIGMINHYGSAYSGHYTSYAKNFKNKNWY